MDIPTPTDRPSTAPLHAVVIGASGGIGGALVDALERRAWQVTPLSRSGDRPIDVTDEGSVATAARSVDRPVDLLLVASGVLAPPGRHPERALREIDAGVMAAALAANTIGPALVLKHFVPLLPRDRRAVVAALSARVGSISDNRSGGWYAYRASKAALNMIVRTAAIELARTHRHAVCVGLHPGTVDTGLSRPFTARVPAERLFEPARAAEQLLGVLDGLRPEDSGACFAWDGTPVPA